MGGAPCPQTSVLLGLGRLATTSRSATRSCGSAPEWSVSSPCWTPSLLRTPAGWVSGWTSTCRRCDAPWRRRSGCGDPSRLGALAGHSRSCQGERVVELFLEDVSRVRLVQPGRPCRVQLDEIVWPALVVREVTVEQGGLPVGFGLQPLAPRRAASTVRVASSASPRRSAYFRLWIATLTRTGPARGSEPGAEPAR